MLTFRKQIKKKILIKAIYPLDFFENVNSCYLETRKTGSVDYENNIAKKLSYENGNKKKEIFSIFVFLNTRTERFCKNVTIFSCFFMLLPTLVQLFSDKCSLG